MFNTSFFNFADFLKIGIMAVLFLALLRFVVQKIAPQSAE